MAAMQLIEQFTIVDHIALKNLLTVRIVEGNATVGMCLQAIWIAAAHKAWWQLPMNKSSRSGDIANCVYTSGFLPMANNGNLDPFWPPIKTPAEAKQMAQQGLWAAITVAGLTTFSILIAIIVGSEMGDLSVINAWAFIDAGLFVAIALGIRKLSRFATVSGLVLYWLNRIYFWLTFGFEGYGFLGYAIITLVTIGLINGIRGTFAYHRLRRS